MWTLLIKVFRRLIKKCRTLRKNKALNSGKCLSRSPKLTSLNNWICSLRRILSKRIRKKMGAIKPRCSKLAAKNHNKLLNQIQMNQSQLSRKFHSSPPRSIRLHSNHNNQISKHQPTNNQFHPIRRHNLPSQSSQFRISQRASRNRQYSVQNLARFKIIQWAILQPPSSNHLYSSNLPSSNHNNSRNHKDSLKLSRQKFSGLKTKQTHRSLKAHRLHNRNLKWTLTKRRCLKINS